MHQPGVLPVFPVFCSVRRFGETFRLTGNRDRRQDKDHRGRASSSMAMIMPCAPLAAGGKTGAKTCTVGSCTLLTAGRKNRRKNAHRLLTCVLPCRWREEPARKRALSFGLCARLAAGGKNRRKNVHRRLVYSPHRRQEEPAQKRAPSFGSCAPLAAGGKNRRGNAHRLSARVLPSPLAGKPAGRAEPSAFPTNAPYMWKKEQSRDKERRAA